MDCRSVYEREKEFSIAIVLVFVLILYPSHQRGEHHWEVLPGVASYCFLILWSQNARFCSPCTDKSPTDFNGEFACIRDKRAGPKLCTMMQSDPPAVEIDVIAFSPSPLFCKPSLHQPMVTPGGLLTQQEGCSCVLEQQERGGDLLKKFIGSCLLDVTLENGQGHGSACAKKIPSPAFVERTNATSL